MGRGPWSPAPSKGKAAAVGAFLVSLLGAPPLGATCSCSITATLTPPDLVLFGRSSGACEAWTRIGFSLSGLSLPYASAECFDTSCSLNYPTTSACLRTGLYTATAQCQCGKIFPGANGTLYCGADPEKGTAETTFFVNTTPTVGVSVSGLDAEGAGTATIPFSFPNTIFGDPHRKLTLSVDGVWLADAYGSQVTGTWTKALVTACWTQGSHQVKAVAVACGQSGDAAYRAEAVTPVQVDHKPSVSLSVSPPDPGGLQVATVAFSFPQTLYDTQRLLALRAIPSGTTLGWIRPYDRSGTWRPGVYCSNGANAWVEAVAEACGDTQTKAAAALPLCPRPPRKDDGCGKSGNQCCLAGGAGAGGGGPGFGGKSGPPGMGPGARLHYLAGGAGSLGNPGQAAWNAILGRGWSHDYAERIVPAAGGRAWLITRYGSFREFTDANNDGLYEKASPEDEYRTLTKTAAGWTLRDLDGTVLAFDSAGLWQSTTDRNGNAKTATYTGGRLTGVTMPDGRREAFAYHASGKLASIKEIGVGGVAQRTWSLTWQDNDLVAMEAPDGTGQRFVYGDSRNPSYMTRRLLVGVDDGDPATPRPERVESAWEYDGLGNVVKTWRGSPDFATGVERHEFAYENPIEPTRTTLTIHRSGTEREVVVYNLSRTVAYAGAKPRVTSISGDCSSCGLAPNSQLFYDDPVHPLLPTRMLDGRGTETRLRYDARGRIIEKTEAAGTPLSRTTTWTYDGTFPALPTRIEAPSTAGGTSRRTTLLTYDTAGNLTSRRTQGVEAGSFFDLETVTTFHASGQPLSVDPPGYGDDDETSFTWDSARGNLLPLTRTEPLVGATTFEHDPFNRQTAVTDPNSVRTETVYDGLNRTLTVTQKGATATDDLVTSHEYNAFGDLLRTTLPRGNVIEYGYDTAGRLISIERKPDATTPGERTLYTLDLTGNRIKEELQRWDGAGWVAESWTEYRYQNRCQVGKVIHADGKVTEYAYNCDGHLEKVWDANHPKATNPTPTQLYQYDPLDRLVSITQPWTGAGSAAAVTSYSYDVQDHLTAVTDAEGNTTTYTYGDRDLMTQEASPVSGLTTSAYNEHGEQVTEIDARGVVMTRAIDALDRVAAVTYPDPDLNITYTYDDPAVPFSKGRLTRIARHGESVDYRYDRFGRLLQDGALAYGYDANGNPTSLLYPGGVEAVTTYDYADRPATLLTKRAGQPDQPLVTAASYLPSGPLSSLTLGNGLTETRSYTNRYLPSTIVAGSHLSWSYSTDAVGNILSITDTLNAANNRSYGYQDYQYFLTLGNGPWGPRAWTYDKIGNRLTETRGAATDTYSYLPNGTGGNTPQISQITPSTGPAALYSYDNAGNLLGNGTLPFSYGADRRMSQSGTAGSGTTYAYDGRGFLRRSALSADYTIPTYNSAGLLQHRFSHRISQAGSERNSDLYVFYFADRPVATLDNVTEGTTVGGFTATSTWQYLTVDHLGTPILAAGPAGIQLWQGGFEPFGTDYSASSGVLRFPGQWSDATWNGSGIGLYYNLHRWYEAGRGRYTQPDPMGLLGGVNEFIYALSNPIQHLDRDGRHPVPSTHSGDALAAGLAACVLNAFREGQRFGQSGQGWRYAHCMTACSITKDCGGTQRLAYLLGLANEIYLQTPRCIVGIYHDGQGTTENSCHTALSPQDFIDNSLGYTCPASTSCEIQCGPLFGLDKTPDQFGPLYGRKPRDLRTLWNWLNN
jgi:RHS repeat-associated protein